MTYSYHIFYFPFKWEIKGTGQKVFSEQISLKKIHCREYSEWEHIQSPDSGEEQDLYNEKNYYYKFVHNILYDEEKHTLDLIRHFERKEPKVSDNLRYLIKIRDRMTPYSLAIDAINVNLYATGVGFLSFYLKNDDESQSRPEDILSINQYGRRILPPFYADITYRNETSEYLAIEGLHTGRTYKENFQGYTPEDVWKPASFVVDLLEELSDNISVEPIIDDRLFVISWYKNDGLAKIFTEEPLAYCDADNDFSSFWYKFVFIDNKSGETCQNDEMKERLLRKHTYTRWQKWSSLYGVSRYSLVYLTNSGAPEYLAVYFRTIYARMAELVLVQRASMLRFSGEVTKVSNLSNQNVDVISVRISSLYKEYIRFINQIYFREVTAQDQGIELYSMLQSCLKMEEYIKDLDNEIGELHTYVSLKEERSRSRKASVLNDIATLFLPMTVITGFFGMNKLCEVFSLSEDNGLVVKLIFLLAGTLLALLVIFRRNRKL